MYEQALVPVGLSYYQAIIYETLLKEGALPASKISQKTPFKRGLVYKVLEELVKEGLIEKEELPKKVAIFKPSHPTKLRSFAERKEQQARDAKLALDGVLASIVSDFNAVSGKPGVLYYEGEAGVREVIFDSLKSQTEILTVADLETVHLYGTKINQEASTKRKKLGIKKRILALDSEEIIKKSQDDEWTEYRFIDKEFYPFQSVSQIYDGKVSYINFEEKKPIGIIIQNQHIYEMQKSLFEFVWSKAKKPRKEEKESEEL